MIRHASRSHPANIALDVNRGMPLSPDNANLAFRRIVTGQQKHDGAWVPGVKSSF